MDGQTRLHRSERIFLMRKRRCAEHERDAYPLVVHPYRKEHPFQPGGDPLHRQNAGLQKVDQALAEIAPRGN